MRIRSAKPLREICFLAIVSDPGRRDKRSSSQLGWDLECGCCYSHMLRFHSQTRRLISLTLGKSMGEHACALPPSRVMETQVVSALSGNELFCGLRATALFYRSLVAMQSLSCTGRKHNEIYILYMYSVWVIFTVYLANQGHCEHCLLSEWAAGPQLCDWMK